MKDYKAGDRFKLSNFELEIICYVGSGSWSVRSEAGLTGLRSIFHIHDDDMPEKGEGKPEQGFKVGDKVWWNSSAAVVVSARWSNGMWNYTLDYESSCGTPLSVVVECGELAKRPA